MKITIDTKEDSHDEIRKVIRMLQHLVGESSISNQGNIFGDSSSSSSSSNDSSSGLSAFGAMFGDDSSKVQGDSYSSDTISSEKKKAFDEESEIIPY